MFKALHLISLLAALSSSSGAEQEVKGFAKDAFSHLEVLKNQLKIDKCVQIARNKATQFSRSLNDRSLAIAWANLYTQDCNYIDPDDGSTGFFYSRMNQELRGPSRNGSSQLFTKSANILNSALDVLGLKHEVKNVYRGEQHDTDFNHSPVTYKDFTSTSRLCEIALGFCCNGNKRGTFMIIEKARGVFIKNYSQKHEEEVLMQTGSKFKVESIVKNITNITKLLSAECYEGETDEYVQVLGLTGFGIPRRLVKLIYRP